MIRPIQTHQRMSAFIAWTAWTWVNLHITRKITLNEPLCNVGEARWQINKIEINVLDVNITYYLLFETLQNAQILKLILQGCMNTRRGRAEFKTFESYWTA